MKSLVLPRVASALSLALLLNACGKEAAQPVAEAKPAPVEATPAPAAPKAAEPKPVEAAPPAAPAAAPAPAPMAEPQVATAVELNGFGSDEPILRIDEPTRGVLHVPLGEIKRSTGAHWDQFDCTSFAAKRSGTYEVRLTYTMRHANLGTQFRIGGQAFKKSISSAPQPKQVIYGQFTLTEAGPLPFVLYIAASGAESGFTIQDIALVPAPEGPAPAAAADGSLVLDAHSATTWSETMRYEPKPEKNCLGFWTSPDDFAEWKFEAPKPGRYKVTVVHGCGGGNHGSEVAVKLADQELKFTVQDTGGFQKWTEVPVGEVEIKSAGPQYLVVDPLTKAKSAVLDVSKVILTPAS